MSSLRWSTPHSPLFPWRDRLLGCRLRMVSAGTTWVVHARYLLVVSARHTAASLSLREYPLYSKFFFLDHDQCALAKGRCVWLSFCMVLPGCHHTEHQQGGCAWCHVQGSIWIQYGFHELFAKATLTIRHASVKDQHQQPGSTKSNNFYIYHFISIFFLLQFNLKRKLWRFSSIFILSVSPFKGCAWKKKKDLPAESQWHG